MGCFNSSGFISKLPIHGGDRVVCFIALTADQISGHELYDPDAIVQPFFLPVRGCYDEYGSVESIDRTPVVDLIEKYANAPIEDVLKSIERCLYGHNLEENIEYWSRYGEECKMYDNLKKFFDQAKIENPRPVLMMEHEEIYDKITENFVESGYWYNLTPKERFTEFYEIISEVQSIYHDNQERFDKENLGPILFSVIPDPLGTCDHLSLGIFHLIMKFDQEGDEEIEKRLKILDERMSRFYCLMGSSCPGDTMGMFDMLAIEDKLKTYTDCKEEFRRFYNLWYVFSRAPMYFAFSQTAGMQEFDYELHERVYNACLDRLKKGREEWETPDEEEEEEIRNLEPLTYELTKQPKDTGQ